VIYVLGAGFSRSLDGGVTFTPGTAPPDTFVWYPQIRAIVNSTDADIVYYAQTSGAITEYNFNLGSATDITGRSSITIAGWESFKVNDTQNYIRAISRTGALAFSTDDLANITVIAQPNPSALTSCDRRLLTSFAGNRQVIVTACFDGNQVEYSVNGGQQWTVKELGACTVTNIAVTQARIFFSCGGQDDSYYFSYENY
jgi:hypothetical protein